MTLAEALNAVQVVADATTKAVAACGCPAAPIVEIADGLLDAFIAAFGAETVAARAKAALASAEASTLAAFDGEAVKDFESK